MTRVLIRQNWMLVYDPNMVVYGPNMVVYGPKSHTSVDKTELDVYVARVERDVYV